MLETGSYEGYRWSVFSYEDGYTFTVTTWQGEELEVYDVDRYDEAGDDPILYRGGEAKAAAFAFIEEYIEGNLSHGNRFMSYEDAVGLFKDSYEQLVIDAYGRDDVIAMREAFNDWTDALCKDGRIDSTQYDGWDNPY